MGSFRCSFGWHFGKYILNERRLNCIETKRNESKPIQQQSTYLKMWPHFEEYYFKISRQQNVSKIRFVFEGVCQVSQPVTNERRVAKDRFDRECHFDLDGDCAGNRRRAVVDGGSISTLLFLFWGNWINEDNSGRNLDNLDKKKQIRFQIIPAVSKMNPSDQSGDYSFHPFPPFLNGNIPIKITINHFQKW